MVEKLDNFEALIRSSRRTDLTTSADERQKVFADYKQFCMDFQVDVFSLMQSTLSVYGVLEQRWECLAAVRTFAAEKARSYDFSNLELERIFSNSNVFLTFLLTCSSSKRSNSVRTC